MTHLGLFEGIGGFSLAARWMGWDTIAWCEINPFGQQVLKHHFPNATGHSNIIDTDFSIYRGRVDILTGGFPCQPFSTAGKRLGTEDERHLWPEMLRAIREVQPRYIVGENVGGILSWDGGMVFEQVHVDLEAEGYEIQAFVLPACAVNAPHRRDRVWFVAHRPDAGAESVRQSGQNAIHGFVSIADTSSEGLQGRENNGAIGGVWKNGEEQPNGLLPPTWESWPTQSPLRDGDDGFPARLDGITLSKWRNESIKAAGNAIVPQVAHQIFKAIEAYNHTQCQAG
jgi:DNA (cytosine-5)-methyltransferase 1